MLITKCFFKIVYTAFGCFLSLKGSDQTAGHRACCGSVRHWHDLRAVAEDGKGNDEVEKWKWKNQHENRRKHDFRYFFGESKQNIPPGFLLKTFVWCRAHCRLESKS